MLVAAPTAGGVVTILLSQSHETFPAVALLSVSSCCIRLLDSRNMTGLKITFELELQQPTPLMRIGRLPSHSQLSLRPPPAAALPVLQPTRFAFSSKSDPPFSIIPAAASDRLSDTLGHSVAAHQPFMTFATIRRMLIAANGQTSGPDAAAFLLGSRPRQPMLTTPDRGGFRRHPSTTVFPHRRPA
jgi:hypothetical protein